MKKDYIIILIAILFSGTGIAQTLQKNFINYQGVARSASNELMTSENMTISIALRFGSANAIAQYEENHNITTDANGVFSLKIGNGSTVSGDFNNLPWGSLATYVTVLMNGNEVGTTEMMAVPYAISSGDADDQSATEVPYDNSTSGLTATTTQDAIDELVGSGAVDADSDPTNELQNLSFDAVTNELSLSNGNLVVLPSGSTDADADPTNELQTISFDATTNELSLTDGGVVTIPSGGTDADADPTNEFQNLSFDATTNELSLTDGNTVTIPSGGTDADADPTNEIQDISLSGTELTISDGSTIDLAPIVPPGGTDDQTSTEVPYDNAASGLTATNAQAAIDELAGGGTIDTDDQGLILTGDVLTIEDGTGSIDLSVYRDNAGGGSGTGLEKITENGNSGWRLTGQVEANYDDIGENATDVSFSDRVSSNYGAGGKYAFATGNLSEASGESSIAAGKFSIASGYTAAAFGLDTRATGESSTAMGSSTLASGDDALATGSVTVASGEVSTAMGLFTKAEAYSSLAIGRNNTGGGDPKNWVATDPLFEIGNGDNNTDSNALTVLKNGTITAPSLALADITDPKALVTKEYVDANGGASLWSQTGNDINYTSGKVGIGTAAPTSVLDIKGGNNWNLTTTEGDFRIGNDTHRLKMGVALGGTGAGHARIRAEGGVDRLTLGAGNKDVLAITPGSVNMIGDFANQGLYQVYPLANSWIPSANVSGKLIPFPGATLTIAVPLGSKVFIGFNSSARIDSDYISLAIVRDGDTSVSAVGGLIASQIQDCYTIAGSTQRWSFEITHLDIDVTPGVHTYEVYVKQSDDADDNVWNGSVKTSFYAMVIKE